MINGGYFNTIQMKSLINILRLIAVLALPISTFSQSLHYPERPVRIIVPFGVGGLADITFRIYSEKLSALSGKQFVVENIPGSGGFTAAINLLKAKPDGHTLMVMTNGTAISKSLYKSMPYDPSTDLIPISFAGDFDLIILARGDSKISNFSQLMSTAKKTDKGLNIGTINPGSTQNLAAEMFKSVTHLNAQIIPYKSTPEALNSLLAGDVDIVFETYATSKSLVDSGKLLALASTGSQRSEYLPKVPTVSELGVGSYEVVGWNALAAATGTPVETVQAINKLMNSVADMSEVKQKLNALGSKAHAGSSQEIQKRFSEDLTKWANVIKQSSIEIQ